MRANNAVELVYAESELPEGEANVYDLGARQTETSRRRRIKTLEHENALLTLMVSEISIEIVRLDRLLGGR